MMRMLRWAAACCAALALTACGEDEPDETAGCTSLLNAAEQCFADWCATEGSSDVYCGCFGEGRLVVAPPGEACACGPEGSWREGNREINCRGDLPDNAGKFIDCAGTVDPIAAQVAARCG